MDLIEGIRVKGQKPKFNKKIKLLEQKIHFKHGNISLLQAKKDELEKSLLETKNDPKSSISAIKELEREIFYISLRIERKEKELAILLISLNKRQDLSKNSKNPNYVDFKPIIIRVEDLLNEAESEIYDGLEKLEEVKEENIRLRQKIEALQAELRRLKKLPPKPTLYPNKTKDQPKIKDGKPISKNKKTGGSQKGKNRSSRKDLKFHHTEKLPLPENIPDGFELMGYQDLIVQDLNCEPLNTRFQIPRLYNRETKETIQIDLPAGIKGHFGGKLRTMIIFLHYQGRMTEGSIKLLLNELGIKISAGQVHKVLIENHEIFHEEKKDILDAGLKSCSFIQTDDTSARHSGHNGFCNIICNEFFTVYNTTKSKSRLNFLMILAQNQDSYIFNDYAIGYLKRIGIPQKWIELFANKNLNFTEKDLKKFIKIHDINGKTSQNLLEAGLIGYLLENDFNSDLIIHSDGAKQFDLFIHCLCWIHAIRPIKAIVSASDHQALIIKDFLKKFWKFYKKLGKYKKNPSKSFAKRLNKEFDEIFTKKTGIKALNEALSNIMANKLKLLLVLRRPEAPIHNNPSETGTREMVVKNKISKTGSEEGKEARDTFLSIMKTSRKLDIPFWHYLNDRIFNINKIPSLGDLIRQKAQSQTHVSAVA